MSWFLDKSDKHTQDSHSLKFELHYNNRKMENIIWRIFTLTVISLISLKSKLQEYNRKFCKEAKIILSLLVNVFWSQAVFLLSLTHAWLTKCIVFSQIFEIEILQWLHVLKFFEPESHFFSRLSFCNFSWRSVLKYVLGDKQKN